MELKTKQRILSLLLAVIMILGIVPLEALAEKEPEPFQGSVGPRALPGPNWEDVAAEELLDKDFWPLQAKTKPRTVTQHEPIKVVDMTFEGSYITAEGRTVLRFKQYFRFGATSGVWDHISYRFDEDLYEKIDWNKSFIYKTDSEEDSQHIKFVNTEEKNTRSLKIFGNNGFGDDKAGSANYDIPIEIYLKENESMDTLKKLKKDLVIQSRIYNLDETNVYTTKFLEGGEGSQEDLLSASYNAYTKTTIIPLLNDVYSNTIEAQPFYTNYANSFNAIHGATGFTMYDAKNGKLRIATGYTKETTALANVDKDITGFKQTYGQNFSDLLKKDGGDVVGRIYTANRDLTYNPNDAQPIKKDDFNNTDSGQYIVVASNTFQLDDSVNVVRSTRFNYHILQNGDDLLAPVWTVVEYDLDKEAVENRFGKDVFLINFGVKSEFIGSTKDNYREYSFYTEEDILAPKDSFIRVKFKNSIKTDRGHNADLFIKIGDKEKSMIYGYNGYNNKEFKVAAIDDRTEKSLDVVYFDSSLRGGSNNYRLNLRNGMTIPAGTKITIYTSARDDKYDDFEVTIGDTIFKTFDQNGLKTSVTKRDSRFTYALRGSEKNFSIQFVKNNLTPLVNEIFTDSTELTGHTYYPLSTVRADQSGIILEEQSANQDQGEEVKVKDKQGEEKPYTGYPFKISTKGDVVEGSKPGPVKLAKDMMIKFRSTRDEMVPGDYVEEQVQAKVNFNLDKDKKTFIEKIAPLNKEYSFDPKTGDANTGYQASGFEGDQLRVDEMTANVKVDRVPLDGSEGENDLKPSYPNYLNHNGEAYDLTKEKEKAAFLKRIFPDPKYDADLRKDGLLVRGWTTAPLTNIEGGKTAIEQYNDLVKEGKIIEKVDDWKQVAAGENYVFTASSPLDETLQTKDVYAVWAGPSLVLHSNNTTEDKETLVYLPYTQADKVYTDKKIDAITSPTADNLKKTNTIKTLPMAPYRYETKGDSYDKRLESFRKENSTFIGWTLQRHTSDSFVAGHNNERIGQINSGKVQSVGAGNTIVTKMIPVRTEGRTYMEQNPTIAYVPNGFDYAESKNLETLLKEGEDIHLYANYKEYFKIKLRPGYKNIEGKDFADVDSDGNYGEYVDDVDASKKHNLKMGLLYRTAVTDYNQPTVLQSATYNPITEDMLVKDTDPILQDYNAAQNNTLEWTLPGFDNMGRRRSFVSIVIPEGKEEDYKTFSERDWAKFGITIYVNRSGQTGEAEFAKDAPKELHEQARPHAYGTQIAKQQSFSVAKEENQVDTYSSATFRKPTISQKVRGREDFTGYEIYSTNTPSEVPAPRIHNIMDTDTSITLDWGLAEENANIDKIKLIVPVKAGEGVENQDLTLEKQANGNYTGTLDSKAIAAAPSQDGTMVVSAFDFQGLAGKEVRVQYINNLDVESEVAKTQIQTEQESNKVKVVVQNPINEQKTKPSVTMTIPNEDPTNQVLPGTVYEAQKWDGTQWTTVGTTTVPTGKGPGDQLVIDLDNVADKDLIRINAKEAGKKETPSIDITGPDPKVHKGYIHLDLIGPKADAAAKDETFRRWIELKGTFDEIPEGPITISFKRDGSPQTVSLANKGQAYAYLQDIIADGKVTDIKISAKDKFGNKNESDVSYEKTHVLVLTVRNVMPGRKYIQIKSEYANTQVTLTVIRADGTEVEIGPNTVETSYTRINFVDEQGQAFRVKSGDEISIKGVCDHTDGKTYTSNPYTEFVD